MNSIQIEESFLFFLPMQGNWKLFTQKWKHRKKHMRNQDTYNPIDTRINMETVKETLWKHNSITKETFDLNNNSKSFLIFNIINLFLCKMQQKYRRT